ncbi:MAG: thioesterase family protein [Myxococcota bacterium]|nr:thioesterase family protein [Myxococcota bacterium]
MFTHPHTIRLRDTDAAGVLFFSRQLELAHDAYEAWLLEYGPGIAQVVEGRSYALYIVHADVDLTAPVKLGDRILVQVRVEKEGSRAYTLAYTFFRDEEGDSSKVGTARTVHVSVDRASGHAMPLPDEIRAMLGSARDEGSSPSSA